jgi:hypothetical protein
LAKLNTLPSIKAAHFIGFFPPLAGSKAVVMLKLDPLVPPILGGAVDCFPSLFHGW